MMKDVFANILPQTQDYDEESIVQAIRQRVTDMLDTQPDLLMSYMYRLDVLEKDLKTVLNSKIPGTDIIEEFTQLIWKRQKQRLWTRANFKQPPIEGWEY
jgi:hypothetical protein